MSLTLIEPQADESTELEPGKCKHIIKTEPGQNAAAVVMESRINGTPVTALCGHVFVVQRNPDDLPMCPKCQEIYDLHKIMNENLNEEPTT